MANFCINKNHPTVLEYSKALGLSNIIVASKIGVWQSKNNDTSFPSLQILRASIEKKNNKVFNNPNIEDSQASLNAGALSLETLNKLRGFLNKTGIELHEVEDIYYKGNKVNALGIARIYKGVIEIVKGSNNEALPEETFHFAVELAKNNRPDLYNSMIDNVTRHSIYKQVLSQYSNNPAYQLTIEDDNGNTVNQPDYTKLKEEAIAQVLVQVLKNNENSKPNISSIFRSLWEQLRDLISSYFKLNKSPMVKLSTFEQVVDLVLNDGDLGTLDSISREQDREFFKLFDSSSTSTATEDRVLFEDKSGISDIISDEITQQAEDIQLIDSSVDPTITNNIDSYYIIRSTSQKLKRLTKALYEIFTPKDKQDRLANIKIGTSEANKYWSDNSNGANKTPNPDGSYDKIDYKGNLVTFPELEDIKSEEINQAAKRGSILHKLLEAYLTTDPNRKLEIKNEIEKLKEEAAAVGQRIKVDKWFDDALISHIIKKTLNIDLDNPNGLKDKVLSEVKVANTELGIAGTADLLAIKPNGNILIADLKTGDKFFSGFFIDQLMNYAKDANIMDPFVDSRENKAKMQIAMLVFMLKANNPDLKFEIPQIIYLNSQTSLTKNPETIGIPLDTTLKVIESWIKNAKNEDGTESYPGLHEKYTKITNSSGDTVNLFDIREYTGDSAEVYKAKRRLKDMEGKTTSNGALVSILMEEAAALQMKSEYLDQPLTDSETRHLKTIIKDVEGLILEPVERQEENTKDITKISALLRDVYSIRKIPALNLFSRVYDRALNSMNVDQKNFKFELWDKVKKLTEYHQSKYGKTSQPIYFSNGKGPKGIYDFMIDVDVTKDSIKGNYIKQLSIEDVKNGTISQEQYDFYDFYQKGIQSSWNRVMKQRIQVGVSDNGKPIMKSKEELFGKTALNYYFMPRMEIQRNELLQLKGAKAVTQSWLKSYKDFFVSERYAEAKQYGVPIKYMGSRKIIEGGDHTYNLEASLMGFYNNMTQKYHMDGVYGIGESIKKTLATQKIKGGSKAGSLKYKNTIDRLEGSIALLVNDKEDEIFQSFAINVGDKKINPARIAQGANKLTTASSMYLNVPGSIFNAIQQGMLTLKEAATYSAASVLGGKTDYQYGLGLMSKASAIYSNLKIKDIDAKYIFDGDRTSLKKNKLFFFAQLMRYDTQESMSSVRDNMLQNPRYRLLNEDMLYLLNSIGENGSLYTTMVANLLATKVQDGFGNYYKKVGGSWSNIGNDKKAESEATSMWDAYEYSDKDQSFIYKGPTRGVNKLGEKVEGITVEEITRAKRLSQKAYGSYRDSERVPLEYNVLGSWAMKFKKYLPQVILTMLDKKYVDYSLGQWRKNFESVAKDPNGLPIMEWEGMVNEGVVRLMLNVTMGSVANTFNWRADKFDSYRWGNLSPLQKQQFLYGLSSIISGLFFTVSAGFLFDDDDEDTKLKRRWDRITQDQFGIHPMDMLNTFNTPLAQIVFMKNMAESYKKFVFDSAIMGERIKTGPNKGDFLGWSTIKKKTPFLNVLAQFGILESNEPNSNSNWIVRQLSYR